MTTRMTSQRLGRLIAAGEVETVRQAVGSSTGLLGRGVERAGQGGWTPLHVAVAEGQGDVVRVLVEAGADLAARTEHNRTPLHIALQHSAALVPSCWSSVPSSTRRVRPTWTTSRGSPSCSTLARR
jgi:hypothetical protein